MSEIDDIENEYEITLDDVKKKAVKGITVLTSRSFLLYIISIFAQGVLWAYLTPSEFGVFYLVSATINFLSYFADIGLGAALIQKKEVPKEEDYKTVFAVQEVLVISIVTIVFLISPLLARINSFSREALFLLYALNISFFLASLKNIPSIILERKLEFQKFVIPQILENVVYYVVLVYFAWKGYGITSFTYAVLVRSLVGLVVIYILQPWKPGVALSKTSLKSLLKFGIPYQFNNFLATFKDDGLTVVIGGILGTYALGILGMAKTVSQLPLRFIMDNVTKVTFPAFSRMQNDYKYLVNSLNRSVFFISSLIFPSLIGLLALFPLLIEVVPKWGKWDVAYIPLIFLILNSSIAAVTTQLTNILTSIGKIKTTLKLMVMWTVLSWMFLPLFSKVWGVNGAALGYLIVGSSSFIVFFLVKKIVDWNITYSVVKPFSAAVLMGVVLYFLRTIVPENLLFLVVLISAGSVMYFVFMYLFIGKMLVDDVKKLFYAFIKK